MTEITPAPGPSEGLDLDAVEARAKLDLQGGGFDLPRRDRAEATLAVCRRVRELEALADREALGRALYSVSIVREQHATWEGLTGTHREEFRVYADRVLAALATPGGTEP